MNDKSKHEISNAMMSEEILKIEYGKALQRTRENKGISQKKMAELCHVTPQLISKIETGKSFPNLYLLNQLMSILDISLDEMNKLVGNKNNHSDVLTKQQSILIEKIKKEKPSDDLCATFSKLISIFDKR